MKVFNHSLSSIKNTVRCYYFCFRSNPLEYVKVSLTILLQHQLTASSVLILVKNNLIEIITKLWVDATLQKFNSLFVIQFTLHQFTIPPWNSVDFFQPYPYCLVCWVFYWFFPTLTIILADALRWNWAIRKTKQVLVFLDIFLKTFFFEILTSIWEVIQEFETDAENHYCFEYLHGVTETSLIQFV